MDWKTIHAYAEEAELWSTLAINGWALATGVILLLRGRRKKVDYAISILRGLEIVLIVALIWTIYAAYSVPFTPPWLAWPLIGMLTVAVAVVLYLFRDMWGPDPF